MKSFYISLGAGILWLLIAISNVFTENYTTVAIYGIVAIVFFIYAIKSWKENKKK